MASVPTYGHLSHEDEKECNHWNQARTANPNSPLEVALSNPPPLHQLYTDGYDTFEQLKSIIADQRS